LDDPAVGPDVSHVHEHRYRALFDNALEGIAYCRMLFDDAGTPIDWVYLDVNPAFGRLTGLRDARGRRVSEVIPGIRATDPQLFEVYGRVAAGGPAERFDLHVQALDEWFDIGVYCPEPGHFVATFEVVSARKRAEADTARMEEQLRLAQKMEAIGQLAGGVAHDFNNLLSVILSYVGLLLHDLPEDDPRREDLAEVRKASEQAAELTHRLLAFSRKQVLMPEPVSLSAVAGGLQKMLGRIIGEDVRLVHTLGPSLWPTVADRGQLEQVILNLVVNARDAMPSGGTITITTKNAELDERYAAVHLGVLPGDYVMLAVTDTGTGMDAETRSRIFEPFFTTKEAGRGTGLGLSTVYGIVKQSQGHIDVQSELGQGTTFAIYLPRRERVADPVRQPTAKALTPAGRDLLLLVEDDDAVRRAAQRILEGAGFRVIAAASGNEALALAEKHAGDLRLVLTDVVMPGMNGRALARELERLQPTIATVFMSGYADHAALEDGVLAPGTHFVAKPFRADQLVDAIRNALRRA